MRLSILVVLYDCNLVDSKTIQTLQSVLNDKVGCRVVVWNNGPRSLLNCEIGDFFPSTIEFDFYETVDNKSLAQIYNYFIQNYGSDSYLFLDHDTSVNRTFINRLFEFSVHDLGVPQVFSGKELEYPLLNWSSGVIDRELVESDVIMSCLSGLVLGRNLVNVFMNHYGSVFDEAFVLYGVDTSFFLRAHNLRLNKQIQILDPIEHSFSRNEKEAGAVSRFRKLERAYDLGLTLRYYPNRHHFKIFYYISKSFCKGRGAVNPFIVARAYLKGRHYRSTSKADFFPVRIK